MSQSNNLRRIISRDIDRTTALHENSSEHGGNSNSRYIALMDLSHFLSNDNVDALLPEVVLNRPLVGGINPSMVELPTTSRNLDLDNLAPPAPPLPRMMKNLLKDRRRFQRQFLTTTQQQQQQQPQMPEFDNEIVNAAHKALENYQLGDLFEKEMRGRHASDRHIFAQDLLYATMLNR